MSLPAGVPELAGEPYPPGCSSILNERFESAVKNGRVESRQPDLREKGEEEKRSLWSSVGRRKIVQ